MIRPIKLLAWRYSGRLWQADDYCHAHSWVPDLIATRVCDLFDFTLGAGSYKSLRQQRKKYEQSTK